MTRMQPILHVSFTMVLLWRLEADKVYACIRVANLFEGHRTTLEL